MMISLVIATLGRHDELDRLLMSLMRQTYRDFEVIVVDQNPESYLADLNARYTTKLTIKWLRCAPHGVSAARNVGIAAVSSEAAILGFPDDDCWYESDTLAQVVAAFAHHPDLQAIIGQWRGQTGGFAKYSESDVDRYSVFRDSMTYNFFIRKTGMPWPMYDVSLGPGTGLPYGCGEDTDYLIAILRAGGKVRRCPSVHVRHPEGSAACSWSKLKAYAIGRQYLLRKWHYPWWFQVLNALYPLFALARYPGQTPYRMKMFIARLRALGCRVLATDCPGNRDVLAGHEWWEKLEL